MRVRGKVCIKFKGNSPLPFENPRFQRQWTLLCSGVERTVTAHCRCCHGGAGRETVRLDENFASVGILCSGWQSVIGESYIVIVSWVEENYFRGFKHLSSFEEFGLSQMELPQKAITRQCFSCSYSVSQKEVVSSSEDKPQAWHQKVAWASGHKLNYWEAF